MIECPYCHKEFEYDNSDGFNQDDEWEQECPHCEKIFMATGWYEECYSSRTLEAFVKGQNKGGTVQYKIIETDNHGGDYPDESFVNIPPMDRANAVRIQIEINAAHCTGDGCPRYWKVVKEDYVLQPGFTP